MTDRGDPAARPLRLAGRVVLITGAAGGIGRAIAARFAGEGATIFCMDVDRPAVERLAADILSSGGRAAAAAGDIANDADAKVAVDAALAQFGRIDVLVTAAAHFPPEAALTEISADEVARALAVNVAGVINISRHVLPSMIAQRRGVIIHLASQLGTVGKPGQALYCATKGAVVTLVKAMALDHAGDGIRVVSLSPGGVATEGMAAKWGDMETAEREWGRAMHPLGRLARVAEVADSALFLASDEASFITGTDLLVDGGYNAR